MTLAEIARSDDPGTGDADDRLAAVETLLQRLAADIAELKAELRVARSERLEDLTLVVDLLTTSWRAVDRRLERIDRRLDRLDRPPSRLP